jgi:hypothetical protein
MSSTQAAKITAASRIACGTDTAHLNHGGRNEAGTDTDVFRGLAGEWSM